MPLRLAFGDPMGTMVACVFFALLSGVMRSAVFGISYRLSAMGSLDEAHTVRRGFSLAMGSLVGFVTFTALYLTSLSGFSRLDVDGATLTLQYSLFERNLTLAATEVARVHAEPAFKGQWRLVLSTTAGIIYESALASYLDIQHGSEVLKKRLIEPTVSRR